MLQHVLVTLIVVGAVAVVVRRFVGTFAPSRRAVTPQCANCPSAAAHGMQGAAATDVAPPVIRVDDLLSRKPHIQVR